MQIEIFLFIKEIKDHVFMNTIDLKFKNEDHKKKYEFKIDKSEC